MNKPLPWLPSWSQWRLSTECLSVYLRYGDAQFYRGVHSICLLTTNQNPRLLGREMEFPAKFVHWTNRLTSRGKSSIACQIWFGISVRMQQFCYQARPCPCVCVFVHLSVDPHPLVRPSTPCIGAWVLCWQAFLLISLQTLCLQKGLVNQVGGATPGKRMMGLRVVSCADVIETGHNQIRVAPARNMGFFKWVFEQQKKPFPLALPKRTSKTFAIPDGSWHLNIKPHCFVQLAGRPNGIILVSSGSLLMAQHNFVALQNFGPPLLW